MKRVLITGGAGFAGHHLIEEIMEKTDWEVVSLDRLDISGNLNRIADIMNDHPEWRGRVSIVWHDLKAALNSQIVNAIGSINYIVHMAAGSHVDRSIEFPMEFVMDNVVGTCNILEYARDLDGLDMFLNFSTDEVFGPAPEGVLYKEWDRYHSGNPYSATKAGAEELCMAFENTYKMPIMVTHTMNIFGERQHPEKYIPMVMRKSRDGEIVTVHSNADKTQAGQRFYIHARDVAEAVLFLFEHGKTGDKYNIVGEKELDNLELAQIIAGHVGAELKYEMVDFHSARPGHDLRYALDGSKMAGMGWQPRMSVEERLGEVVKWTLENEDRWLF